MQVSNISGPDHLIKNHYQAHSTLLTFCNLSYLGVYKYRMRLDVLYIFDRFPVTFKVYIGLIACAWICAIGYKCVQVLSVILRSQQGQDDEQKSLNMKTVPHREEEISMMQVLFPAVRQSILF